MEETATMIKYEDFLGKLKGAQQKERYIVGLCPFHNDNAPSLLIYPDGWFTCLSGTCSRSGNWKTLWNKLQGQPVQIKGEGLIHFHSPASLNGYPTKEEMAYQAHIDLANMTSFQWYMEMRGLADAIDVHEIGYYKGWYTFPIRDEDGNFQSVVYRSAPHVQEATGIRYWAEGKPIMYVPDWRLLNKSNYILVVYGILDALTLNKLRYPVVTSTHGADTFKAEWLDEYRKTIYVIPDKKEEKSALKLARNLGWRGHVGYLDYPDGMKDTNDFLRSGKQETLVAQLSRIIK